MVYYLVLVPVFVLDLVPELPIPNHAIRCCSLQVLGHFWVALDVNRCHNKFSILPAVELQHLYLLCWRQERLLTSVKIFSPVTGMYVCIR